MELIDRQAAIDALVAIARTVDSRYLESERIILESDAVEAISMLPSAQSERKRGQWIHGREVHREYTGPALIAVQYSHWECSVCGYRTENEPLWNFCPICGAEMGGDAE